MTLRPILPHVVQSAFIVANFFKARRERFGRSSFITTISLFWSYTIFTSSNNVDYVTFEENRNSRCPTVLLRSRLKSDRCESASAATYIRPGLCSTVNLYSAKRWDCSQPCVMTHGPYILWKFYRLIDRIWISTERTSWHIVLVVHRTVRLRWLILLLLKTNDAFGTVGITLR